MTITSMSGNELYRTLMGRDNPHANFTETVKNDLSTENPNVTGVKAPDRDSFEYSDGIDFMDPYIRSELG